MDHNFHLNFSANLNECGYNFPKFLDYGMYLLNLGCQ